MSVDGGRNWDDAALDEPVGEFGWRRWTFSWDDAEPGDYELCSRATDEAGNVQPSDRGWNYGGYVNNAVQRVASPSAPSARADAALGDLADLFSGHVLGLAERWFRPSAR